MAGEEDKRPVIQSPLNRSHSDRYYFIMNLPEALKDSRNGYVAKNEDNGLGKEAVKWSLYSVDIPSINIKADALKYMGGNVYLSSHTKSPYSPLTISFKVDNKYKNYLTVYEWINFIYNEKEGHFDAENLAKGKSGLDVYGTTISVVAIDEFANPVVQWVFTHAFPTELSPLQLNYQNTSEIECKATFVFSQMMIRNVEISNMNGVVS